MGKLIALEAIEKFLADVVVDSIKMASDSGTPEKLMEYSNLLPDCLALLPVISDVENEIVSLEPGDYATLVTELAVDLAIPAGRVANVVQGSLKLLEDFITIIVPDVQMIISAAKS